MLKHEVKTAQDAIAAIGCDPTWDAFSNTFIWFRLKQQLSLVERDQYHEAWLYLYGKRGLGNKKTPQRSCRNSGGQFPVKKGGSPRSQVC